MTDRYAVVGNPIAHSKSPGIHTAFAEQTGEDMCYEAILAPLGAFSETARNFLDGGGRGLNVTVPFKLDAYRFAETRTPRAEAAGAVNTLAVTGGCVLGDNTDGAGLVLDLTQNLGVILGGKRILLLGAGGAARGVVLPLLQCGPEELAIANRTAEAAARLAQDFSSLRGCGQAVRLIGGGFDSVPQAPFDLVINATSASLASAQLPLNGQWFSNGAIAYDMMYGKGDTPFMTQARHMGAGLASDGLGMLVEQAAESFMLWRGIRPHTAPVLASLRQ